MSSIKRLEVAGELSKHWLNGNGPSHNRISSAFAAAGYDEPDADHEKSKAERIRRAIRSIDPAHEMSLIHEILQMLREYGVFDHGRKTNDSLIESFRRFGLSLSSHGFIDYDGGADSTVSMADEASQPSGQQLQIDRREIGTALSPLFEEAPSPAPSDIDMAIRTAGYREQFFTANDSPSEGVSEAIRHIDSNRLEDLIQELLALLRKCGTFFAHGPDPFSENRRQARISQLSEALQRSGLALSENGFLSGPTREGSSLSAKVHHSTEHAKKTEMPKTDSSRYRGAEVDNVVFISHAHSDQSAANRVLRLLCDATELRRDQVFCTSLPSQGVSSGLVWLSEVRTRLHNSALTVFLISRHFLESSFCCFELGAVWAITPESSSSRFPLLLDDVDVGDLDPILSSWQCSTLSRTTLAELVDRVTAHFKLPRPRSSVVTAAIDECLKDLQA